MSSRIGCATALAPTAPKQIPGRWTNPQDERRQASASQERALAGKYGALNL